MNCTPRLARHALAVVVLVGALALGTVPASAGSRGHSQSSGRTASAQWIEFGTLPGVAGNVHVGDLFIDASTRNTYAYGSVADWTCPPGERPSGGGHGVVVDDVEPEPSNCIHEGLRFIYGDPGRISFTMDKKLNTARLTGNLEVSSHGGPAAATPPVDMTLTGFGATSTERYRSSYSDGTNSYTFSYTSTARQAAITGRIGIMDFTDDADDESFASMGTYRNMDRWVSR